MRADSTRRPPRTGQPRRVVAGVLLVAGLLAALAAGVTLLGPLVAEQGLGSPLGVGVLAGTALLVLVAGAALTVTVRGRRAQVERTRAALAWFEGLHVCTAVSTRNAVRAEGKEHRSVERVLRMQVASLERALEGQDERLAVSVREEHRKTLLTIAALRVTLDREPGEVVLNRLEAALARIGVTPDFTRPALPAGRTGAPVVFLGAPQPLVPASAGAGTTDVGAATVADPVPPAAQDDGVAPRVDEMAAPDAVPTQDLDAPAAALEEADRADGERRPDTAAEVAPSRPVVRPVPAPVRPADPHQRRRRFRRSAARA